MLILCPVILSFSPAPSTSTACTSSCKPPPYVTFTIFFKNNTKQSPTLSSRIRSLPCFYSSPKNTSNKQQAAAESNSKQQQAEPSSSNTPKADASKMRSPKSAPTKHPPKTENTNTIKQIRLVDQTRTNAVAKTKTNAKKQNRYKPNKPNNLPGNRRKVLDYAYNE